MSRIVRNDTDCADCLCRVCARNVNNDNYNPLEEFPNCSCDHCIPGTSTVIETTDDCPQFLPDIDDENNLEATEMTENNEKLMELRDKFAIEALNGMLAHSTRYRPRQGANPNWHLAIAEEAYELADAMLKVREVSNGTDN